MNTSLQVAVRRASWKTDNAALRSVRYTVFVEEQRVPVELEWDELDEHCLHVVAETVSGAAIGTGRLLPDGHVGRMAVLEEWRRRGVGGLLLEELLSAARARGYPAVELSAQTHAIGFYRRFGFEVVSDEYPDAGILHRTMRLLLVKPAQG
jgi:predicted GNAT family N-acyltransferase